MELGTLNMHKNFLHIAAKLQINYSCIQALIAKLTMKMAATLDFLYLNKYVIYPFSKNIVKIKCFLPFRFYEVSNFVI